MRTSVPVHDWTDPEDSKFPDSQLIKVATLSTLSAGPLYPYSILMVIISVRN
jgi:hypothetical protein